MSWHEPKRRKYRKGAQVQDMASLAKEIESGRYVYLHHKVQHPAVLAHMTYHTLSCFVSGGYAYKAINNEGSK